jgi:hypothetical protein
LSHLASLLSSSRDTLENTIDHGSPYAKSLGFDVEIEWPVDALDDVPIQKPKRGTKKVPSRSSLEVISDKSQGKGSDATEGAEEGNDEDRESYSSGDDGSLQSPESHESNPEQEEEEES